MASGRADDGGARGLVDRLTRAAVRRGLRDGLMAGDGRWLAAGAFAWLVRFLMKRHEPEVVTERLRPGESLLVTNLGRPPRRRKSRREWERARQAEPVAVPATE